MKKAKVKKANEMVANAKVAKVQTRNLKQKHPFSKS